MTPLQRYQAALKVGDIYPDPEQQRIILSFQQMYENLLKLQKSTWQRFAGKLLKPKANFNNGLYIWGDVGAGKTYLMDLFYQSLPFKRKLRMHFHSFMAEVHHLMTQLQGQRDPLQLVAKHFAARACVLCFDEFFVKDIGDAMILGNILRGLFERGIYLIVTSNVAPCNLYHNGLQRQAFLPTIALIEKHLQVEHILAQRDYRLRDLKQAGVYFSPVDTKVEQQLQAWFDYFASKQNITVEPLTILGREIAVVKRAEQVVWFDFQTICHTPRSQNDYLEIVKRYRTIIISNIPQLLEKDSDAVRYLINLIDICYDRRVKLIISAAVPIRELYTKGILFFEFQRTCSRLLEMQSEQYLNGH